MKALYWLSVKNKFADSPRHLEVEWVAESDANKPINPYTETTGSTTRQVESTEEEIGTGQTSILVRVSFGGQLICCKWIACQT